MTTFYLNGNTIIAVSSATTRLSDCLRDELTMTGTKIGCHAGDCGACTVLIDGNQACACIVPLGQVQEAQVVTVEGLSSIPLGRQLQRAFVAVGAAQCGICTPGMLIAAFDLLTKISRPTEVQVQDALGGVLCRCTGYRKIIEAVLAASDAEFKDEVEFSDEGVFKDGDKLAPDRLTVDGKTVPNCSSFFVPKLPALSVVGQSIARLDAPDKVTGKECFGSDQFPIDSLELRVIRSPYAHAQVSVDFDALHQFVSNHGLTGYVAASDIKRNAFAIFADMRDQPVIADGTVRFRGEAVLALVGEPSQWSLIDVDVLRKLPITYRELPAQLTMAQSLAPDAIAVQARYPNNILCTGRVAKNWPAEVSSARVFSAAMTTQHVEHAYIEPEAGYAQWDGCALTVFACTQTPYMDRDELAHLLDLQAESVRIIPSAVGGGFGGKLDLSLQPLIAAAAIKFKRPVRCTYNRPESMVSTTKRHPAAMQAQLAVDQNGNFLSYEFSGDFNTGPYASWGPTVANRVPIHACGPYRFNHVLATTRAVLTHNAVCGAFRGFGVPQSTLLNERLIDEAAQALGLDPLAYRLAQALRAGDTTATGQVLSASVGLQSCLRALQPAWEVIKQQCVLFNAQAKNSHSRLRRGVGVASMWYGIGNTVIANPSTMRVGLRPTGRVMLYNGAVDIGQGTYTVMPQMCAEALGLPLSLFDQIKADTHLTLDAGKSSASRQTFVSGNAARLAGEQLRAKLLSLLSVAEPVELSVVDTRLIASRQGHVLSSLALDQLAPDDHGDLAHGIGYFNPPTIALDANGQGVPYACYGFAAQFAHLEVDEALGTVKLLAIHAAHDVGKAINPVQVEGQIHGGIAQGIGLALMEDYQAGKTDNLHDYLIPTAGDVPPITCYLIEDPEPLGPYGAKGVGEPALVATAPAILNAIADACGVRMNAVPVTPDRLFSQLQLRDRP